MTLLEQKILKFQSFLEKFQYMNGGESIGATNQETQTALDIMTKTLADMKAVADAEKAPGIALKYARDLPNKEDTP